MDAKVLISICCFVLAVLVLHPASAAASCPPGSIIFANGQCETLNITPVQQNCPIGGTLNSNGTCNLGYTPLEPIPGLTTCKSLWDTGCIDITDAANLPALINALYKTLISVGALFGVLMLTIGGIQYMVSEAVPNKMQGLSRARNALWGISLLACSWLILHTINPNLLSFDLNPCPDPTNCQVKAPPPQNMTTGSISQSSSTMTPAEAKQIVDSMSPEDPTACTAMKQIVTGQDTSAVTGSYAVLKALRAYTYSLFGENIGSQNQTMQDERKFVTDCAALGN